MTCVMTHEAPCGGDDVSKRSLQRYAFRRMVVIITFFYFLFKTLPMEGALKSGGSWSHSLQGTKGEGMGAEYQYF